MRVLIVRVGAMGDVLHALPAVAALRKARPDWTIDWVVDPRWAALLVNDLGEGPVVGKVYWAETKAWSAAPISLGTARSVRALRRALRVEKYDVAVDMQGTLRSGVIARMSGAASVVGYGDPREGLAARLYTRRLERRGVHVVQQGAELLGEACGVELVAGEVALPKIAWAEEWAEEAVVARPMCVLGAGGGWGAKQWPAERYGELAARLREMGCDVVVNAARWDDAVAARVVEASGGAARVVACNVAGLVAMLRRTDFFVGGDTGPMHLAAALAVPVVALFGPTDPARNGPWGAGVSRVVRDPSSVTSYKRTEEVEAGLGKVGVEEVLEAVREVVSS